MLTYDVRYRCYISNNIPFVRYKYRRVGMFFWQKRKQAIDDFALKYWKDKYYDADIDDIGGYNRVRIMRDIIDNEYDGSVENYIEAMLEFEIMSDLIEKRGDYETREISLSFITDGCVRTTIGIKNKKNTGA